MNALFHVCTSDESFLEAGIARGGVGVGDATDGVEVDELDDDKAGEDVEEGEKVGILSKVGLE